MSDEIDKEITTKKYTSNSDPSVNGYSVSEESSSTVSTDNSATGLIIGMLFTLALGIGSVAYYLNSRPTPAMVIPSSPNVIKDNKPTVIESTTVKEAPTQPAPKVEVNVPASTNPPASVTTPSRNRPTITTPTVTTPSRSRPTVTTPSTSRSRPTVTTPTVTTPTVTTPTVTTPTVTTPTVTTPNVTIPTVTIPSVSPPAPVTTPSVNPPAPVITPPVNPPSNKIQ